MTTISSDITKRTRLLSFISFTNNFKRT